MEMEMKFFLARSIQILFNLLIIINMNEIENTSERFSDVLLTLTNYLHQEILLYNFFRLLFVLF